MKRYFIHNALFRITAPVVYGVLVYLLILLINNNVQQVNDLFSSEEVYVCIALTYLSLEAMRLIILALDRVLLTRSFGFRMVAQLGATSIVSVALVYMSLNLYFNRVVGFSIGATQLWIFLILFTFTALLYNVLYFSHYYLHKENTVRLQAEKQHREVLEMEMTEFTNDVNPDLLYESLENLIGLIYRDVEKAEEYIDSLAHAYRYVLTTRQQELVPYAQEVEAGRNLVRLLNEKYSGRLQFENEIAEDPGIMLIPGSLPVVIEHMIRNTILPPQETFIIRCYAEDEYLTLQCKLNDRLVQHLSSQTALTRLQQSYAVYTDLPLIRVKAYQENYIKLPVIKIAEETVTTL